MTHRVLVIDDDEAFLEALRFVLGDAVTLTTAGSIAEALRIEEAPDLFLVDLALPDGDGVELVAALATRWPEIPSVVLTVNHADDRVLAAFRAGARGYIYKEDVGSRLLRVIEEARDGGAPMSAGVAKRVLGLVAQLPASTIRSTEQALTGREIDVVRELASGATYEQAAATLGMSLNTVRSHIREIYRKLSVGTRTEAVFAAIQLGLLERR